MLLSEKITTLEEYLKAEFLEGGRTRRIREWYIESSNRFTAPFVVYMLGDNGVGIAGIKATEYVPSTQWWFHRELMRMHTGIYPPATQALAALNGQHAFQHLLAHVSKEDPSMIAFTASAEDGLRDRQTRIALGRFVRRYYNFATDKMIAAIEAAHRVELNPPVEFIIAEKEPERFVKAYQAINSCMSKPIGTYGQSVMHPVAAYCTPGFQLAILKNANDTISARSLVWVNPENPEDKRSVRTYGDVVLANYLTKQGFKPRAFEPAYLKTAVIKGQADGHGRQALICPYVDGGDKAATSEQNSRGVWDGADRIYLLKNGTKLKIPTDYLVHIQNAGGITHGKPFPINRKCAVSGKPINGLTDAFASVWINDKEDVALTSELTGWISASPAYGIRQIYFPADTPTFRHGATLYRETDANRQAMGYVQLDAKLYPNERQWLNKNDTGVYSVNEFGTGKKIFIKADDAMLWIDLNLTRAYIHKDTLPKDAVRLAAIDEMKTWAHPDVLTVRTEANRKVVPGVHPVRQAYDGKWHYERQLHQVMLFGEMVWAPLSESAASIALAELPPRVRDAIDTTATTVSLLANAKKKALFDTFAARGDMLVPLADHGNTYEAGYVFEYRTIPLKLVETFLAADYVEGKVTKAPEAAMRSFHKFGRMVLAQVVKTWETTHPKATVKEAATA